jgi:hypothetical protein
LSLRASLIQVFDILNQHHWQATSILRLNELHRVMMKKHACCQLNCIMKLRYWGQVFLVYRLMNLCGKALRYHNACQILETRFLLQQMDLVLIAALASPGNYELQLQAQDIATSMLKNLHADSKGSVQSFFHLGTWLLAEVSQSKAGLRHVRMISLIIFICVRVTWRLQISASVE